MAMIAMAVVAVIVIVAMVGRARAMRWIRFDRRPHHPEGVGSEKAREDRADQGKEYDELIHDAASALHEIDIFHRDRAAVAEIDDKDGKPDCRFGRGHGEDEEREDLSHEIVEIG